MFKARAFDGIGRLEKELEVMCGFGNHCIGLVPKTEEIVEEVFRIPVADFYETENSFIATFELPGVSKEDIELNVIEDNIEVKVDRKIENNEKEKGAHSHEVAAKRFYGALPLPSDVMTDKIDATYKDGILRVEIPKAEKQESRKKIEIK